jgi:hypothetical protein
MIRARSAERGFEVSSPAPRTLPSVQDRDHNTLRPPDSSHNQFLFEQRRIRTTFPALQSKDRSRPVADRRSAR